MDVTNVLVYKKKHENEHLSPKLPLQKMNYALFPIGAKIDKSVCLSQNAMTCFH